MDRVSPESLIFLGFNIFVFFFWKILQAFSKVCIRQSENKFSLNLIAIFSKFWRCRHLITFSFGGAEVHFADFYFREAEKKQKKTKNTLLKR